MDSGSAQVSRIISHLSERQRKKSHTLEAREALARFASNAHRIAGTVESGAEVDFAVWARKFVFA